MTSPGLLSNLVQVIRLTEIARIAAQKKEATK